jgi:hypothetical protein
MTRLSRLVLGAALLTGAACSGAPTEPTPTRNTMAPDAGALFDEAPECRGGFTVPNGKTC